MKLHLALLIPLFMNSQAIATPPILGLPVQCEIGKDCLIQNYVDHVRGIDITTNGGATGDYRCGTLTYDTSNGTDFRLPLFEQFEGKGGVPVVAAADGVITSLRDGMPDRSLLDFAEQTNILKREAGNGVLINHGQGWETQYNHMRNASLKVHKGQLVKKGDLLGYIGSSGKAEYPHLKFIVRNDNHVVDPFVGDVAVDWECGGKLSPLWEKNIQQQIIYQPTGLIRMGISPKKVSYSRISGGLDEGQKTISTKSPQLALWSLSFGALEGDIHTLRLFDPRGDVISERRHTTRRDKPQWFMYTGKNNRHHLRPGTYKGIYILKRRGLNLIEETTTVEVQ